ncbi:hypothetical protein FACS189472_08790 [Alphaproteobacteria bacterium]|nr:hypothetical protein FACS189472_08790 [Alphaproteobacteria bacterium]
MSAKDEEYKDYSEIKRKSRQKHVSGSENCKKSLNEENMQNKLPSRGAPEIRCFFV